MAFQLNVQTKYGVDINYWKISKIEKDYFSETAYIEIYGFQNQEVRNQMKDCLEKKRINIYPADFQKIFGMEQLDKEDMNDTKSLYLFIKEHFDEFKEAEVVDNIIPELIPVNETIQQRKLRTHRNIKSKRNKKINIKLYQKKRKLKRKLHPKRIITPYVPVIPVETAPIEPTDTTPTEPATTPTSDTSTTPTETTPTETTTP